MKLFSSLNRGSLAKTERLYLEGKLDSMPREYWIIQIWPCRFDKAFPMLKTYPEQQFFLHSAAQYHLRELTNKQTNKHLLYLWAYKKKTHFKSWHFFLSWQFFLGRKLLNYMNLFVAQRDSSNVNDFVSYPWSHIAGFLLPGFLRFYQINISTFHLVVLFW